MYSIGEYARIAQVSKRLLRYYDEIALFQPIKIEPESGHRYYSASQLPELNRILALKDLGLSLNQIQRFVGDDISPAEIQGLQKTFSNLSSLCQPAGSKPQIFILMV